NDLMIAVVLDMFRAASKSWFGSLLVRASTRTNDSSPAIALVSENVRAVGRSNGTPAAVVATAWIRLTPVSLPCGSAEDNSTGPQPGWPTRPQPRPSRARARSRYSLNGGRVPRTALIAASASAGAASTSGEDAMDGAEAGSTGRLVGRARSSSRLVVEVGN